MAGFLTAFPPACETDPAEHLVRFKIKVHPSRGSKDRLSDEAFSDFHNLQGGGGSWLRAHEGASAKPNLKQPKATLSAPPAHFQAAEEEN
jgi:hypothetical protein